MFKNMYLLALIPFFFNVTLTKPILDALVNTPKTKRLSPQERQARIERQQREIGNNSPKRLRPLDKVSTIVASVQRSISPAKRR